MRYELIPISGPNTLPQRDAEYIGLGVRDHGYFGYIEAAVSGIDLTLVHGAKANDPRFWPAVARTVLEAMPDLIEGGTFPSAVPTDAYLYLPRHDEIDRWLCSPQSLPDLVHNQVWRYHEF